MTGMAMNMLSGSSNKNSYGSHGSSSGGMMGQAMNMANQFMGGGKNKHHGNVHNPYPNQYSNQSPYGNKSSGMSGMGAGLGVLGAAGATGVGAMMLGKKMKKGKKKKHKKYKYGGGGSSSSSSSSGSS